MPEAVDVLRHFLEDLLGDVRLVRQGRKLVRLALAVQPGKLLHRPGEPAGVGKPYRPRP